MTSVSVPSAGPRVARGVNTHVVIGVVIALIFIVTVVLPIASVLYGALQDRSPVYGQTSWSLEPVQRLLASTSFASAVRNTLSLSVVVTIASLLIGTGLAWLVARTDVPAKNALSVLIIAPLFLSPLTGALAWIILAAPNIGLLNIATREAFGEGRVFNIFSFTGVAFVMVLHYVPYCFMSVYAMLSNMNAALEESARSLGAGTVRTALRITIPLAVPAMASSAVLIFILSSEMFTIPGLLGRPFDFETVVYSVYYAIRREPAEWNTAAAIGFVLLLMVAVGLFAQNLIKGAQAYSVIGGQGFKAFQIRAGRWRWALFGLTSAFIFVAVVLPMAALVFGSLLEFTTSNPRRMIFTLDNYRSLAGGIALDAIQNTVILSIAAPTAVVGFVFFVGYWCRQPRSGAASGWFIFLMRLPLALPGVVLGVGMLWLYFRVPLPVYGSLLILFLAYFTNLLPFAANNVLPALQQVDRSLDESARILGASSANIARRIHAPLTTRAIVAGWLVGFILCSRELNASIMLYTPTTRVMEVLIWDLTESGRSNFAYAISVVQATVIALLAFVVHVWVGRQGLSTAGATKP